MNKIEKEIYINLLQFSWDNIHEINEYWGKNILVENPHQKQSDEVIKKYKSRKRWDFYRKDKAFVEFTKFNKSNIDLLVDIINHHEKYGIDHDFTVYNKQTGSVMVTDITVAITPLSQGYTNLFYFISDLYYDKWKELE